MDRLLRAALQPPRGVSPGACPEATLLAAFVEGHLTASEQSTLEAHVAACDRCQETLAVLSQEPSLEDVEEAVAPAETGWFTWVTRPRLRWLVPISAAATVAVVFFTTRPLIAPEGEAPSTEVARIAQAPSEPARASDVERLMERDKAAAVAPAKPETEPAVRQETGKRQANQVAGTTRSADAPPPTLVGQVAPDKEAMAGAGAGQAPAGRAAADEQRPRAVAEPGAPQIAAAPTPASAPTKGASAAKIPAADAVRAMPATAQSLEELRRLEPVATVMAAPDGRVRWRLGPGGRIWQSTDAGSTWHRQPADVSADLVAGSAPSASTCWAVGTGGVVLLTVDGQRWTLLPFPLSVDLAAVQATSDRIAMVTTRDGRRFETLDAGLTWSPKQ
jgi:hypothetical protein